MKMKVLIATTNPGKFDELSHFLKNDVYDLCSLKDLGITGAVEETGVTFEENAILKATYYASLAHMPAIADDGGFEIDALGGAPGVKSHRWIHGDREDTDDELIAYTLEKMKGLPQAERGAQLRLVLAFAIPTGENVTSEASVRGIVAETPSIHRTEGFPYRSLLFLPEINKYYDHKLLTPEETKEYNHRRRAIELLKPEIAQLLTRFAKDVQLKKKSV